MAHNRGSNIGDQLEENNRKRTTNPFIGPHIHPSDTIAITIDYSTVSINVGSQIRDCRIVTGKSLYVFLFPLPFEDPIDKVGWALRFTLLSG